MKPKLIRTNAIPQILAGMIVSMAILLTPATAFAADSDKSVSSSFLFVQTAPGGSLVPAGDIYRLTLNKAAPAITYFAERPSTKTGVSDFTEMVDAIFMHEYADPNAALIIDENGKQITVPMALSNPTRISDGTVQYDVRLLASLNDRVSSAARVNDVNDIRVAAIEKFGAAELFIDSSHYGSDCQGGVKSDVDLTLNKGRTSPSPYSSHWNTIAEHVSAFRQIDDGVWRYEWDGGTGKKGPSFDMYYDAKGYDATFKMHNHCWNSFWNGAEVRSNSCDISGKDAHRFNCHNTVDKQGQQPEHAGNFSITLK